MAWKYQEKLYRYFIARWGYSRALAIWFIIDEVNGTDGWATETAWQPPNGEKKSIIISRQMILITILQREQEAEE